jgi:hypothetical protein
MSESLQINLRMPRDIVEELDKAANYLHLNPGGRSRVIKMACEDFLDIFQLWTGRNLRSFYPADSDS